MNRVPGVEDAFGDAFQPTVQADVAIGFGRAFEGASVELAQSRG